MVQFYLILVVLDFLLIWFQEDYLCLVLIKEHFQGFQLMLIMIYELFVLINKLDNVIFEFLLFGILPVFKILKHV